MAGAAREGYCALYHMAVALAYGFGWNCGRVPLEKSCLREADLAYWGTLGTICGKLTDRGAPAGRRQKQTIADALRLLAKDDAHFKRDGLVNAAHWQRVMGAYRHDVVPLGFPEQIVEVRGDGPARMVNGSLPVTQGTGA